MAIGSLLKPITVGRAPPRSWPSTLKSIPLFRRSNPAFPLRTFPSPRPLTIAPLSALKPSDAFCSNDEKKPFPSRIAALVVLFLVFKQVALISPHTWSSALNLWAKLILGLVGGTLNLAFLVGTVIFSFTTDAMKEVQRIRVYKIQVGLLGMAGTLKKDLDQVAEIAASSDLSASKMLHGLLKETALALLRYPDCWFSAYTSVHAELSRVDVEKKRWLEELDKLEKFSQMTLLNLNKTSKRPFIYRKKTTKTTKDSPNYLNNGYIVVTIMLAVDPNYKLPAINGREDLKKALQRLVSVPSDKTMAVEVLWTPQNEKDTPLERDLCEDFPLLRPL